MCVSVCVWGGGAYHLFMPARLTLILEMARIRVDPVYAALRYGTSLAQMSRSSFGSLSESPTRSVVWCHRAPITRGWRTAGSFNICSSLSCFSQPWPPEMPLFSRICKRSAKASESASVETYNAAISSEAKDKLSETKAKRVQEIIIENTKLSFKSSHTRSLC